MTNRAGLNRRLCSLPDLVARGPGALSALFLVRLRLKAEILWKSRMSPASGRRTGRLKTSMVL